MVLMSLYRWMPFDVVVAHFDHGMRPSSADDAEFVRKKAKEYDMEFVLGKGHLGPNASEAEARAARYRFLRKVMKEYGAQEIVTAHHVNDLAESVAINIIRGTGWRGLTPFSEPDVYQPFIYGTQPISKYDIYLLGLENDVTYRQDPSNTEDKYLRNRIRKSLFDGLNRDEMLRLLELHQDQIALRSEIELEVKRLLPEDGRYERDWFRNLDDEVALEILYLGMKRKGILATRPQILDFLNAIRTYSPHKKFNLPNDKLVTIYKNYFVL